MRLPEERTEAFLEGHVRAFAFFAGVPRRISYDNLKIAVAEITGGRSRKLTEAFLRLQSYHLFADHFCRVRRPNEKGHVENLIITDKINQLPAVAVIYSFPGMSLEQYHDILSRVKFDSSSRRAHIASETPEGMFVIAIWESEAAFHTFEPALRAAFAAAGVEYLTPVIGKVHRIAVSPDAALTTAHA